ncbi:ATP-binding protein [Streptomonospora salina]|uniref:Anti-sigma regulatory factor (Ser/Thr protein kinase) n=1 Tax=Streptomonospora salina TaxID=104205 RepID=A0A841EDE8_9ACTN|nr:ATP-binding protein [Streptomonospora salina]MBB5998480.1 anti-sigma regulatory factor (Ser/Thr protein kinase) [Streptomonospora salina]
MAAEPAATVLSLPRRIPSSDPGVHSASFGWEPEQVAGARSWAWRVTGRAYDRAHPMMLALSELHSNAIKHTVSGLPGGRVRIDITLLPQSVHLAVTDHGQRPEQPPTRPQPCASSVDDIDEAGRGLALIQAISCAWGYYGTTGLPTTVWALFDREPRRDG